MQGKEDQEITFGPGYGVNLPADIDAQKGLSILIRYEGARKAIALSKPAIAWVRTDTGHRFHSPRVQVIQPGTSGYKENLEPTMFRQAKRNE